MGFEEEGEPAAKGGFVKIGFEVQVDIEKTVVFGDLDAGGRVAAGAIAMG